MRKGNTRSFSSIKRQLGWLVNDNYWVISASDGLEALAIYVQQPQEIKVVLMDLIMPEIDGLTALRALKKINSNVKLIITSGLATKEQVTIAHRINWHQSLANQTLFGRKIVVEFKRSHLRA